MKTRTFQIYSDPAHAWIKVPKEFLRQIIGKDWRKVFTPFSYERKDYVYLEEDKDAARFINWCNANGIQPLLKESTSRGIRRSIIRTYSRLQPIGD